MRLIAALLLTVLCFGLSAADFSAGDLTAIADKAKTMKVGEATSVKVMINGKPVYVGLVMGASGLTVAGEGVPAGTYKFLYTDQGLVVQSTQAGQTKTVAVANGKVQPADNDLARAFGAGAVSTWSAVQAERLAVAQTADQQEIRNEDSIGGPMNVFFASHDLNSLNEQIFMAFNNFGFGGFGFGFDDGGDGFIPDSTLGVVTQTQSNQQTVISDNASGAPNP